MLILIMLFTWLCEEGRTLFACMLFGEMLDRGVQFDCATLGKLICGLSGKEEN